MLPLTRVSESRYVGWSEQKISSAMDQVDCSPIAIFNVPLRDTGRPTPDPTALALSALLRRNIKRRLGDPLEKRSGIIVDGDGAVQARIIPTATAEGDHWDPRLPCRVKIVRSIANHDGPILS